MISVSIFVEDGNWWLLATDEDGKEVFRRSLSVEELARILLES